MQNNVILSIYTYVLIYVCIFQLIGGYSVCKTALLGLIKAMAPACAEKNIRVNGLAPGIIKTKFSEGVSCCFLYTICYVDIHVISSSHIE